MSGWRAVWPAAATVCILEPDRSFRVYIRQQLLPDRIRMVSENPLIEAAQDEMRRREHLPLPSFTDVESEAARMAPAQRGQLYDHEGGVCAARGAHDEAIRWYGRAIDAFLEARYIQTAQAMCRKLIAYAPDVVRARATLALLHVGTGFEPEAVTEVNCIAAYLRAAVRAGQQALAIHWFRVLATAADGMELKALAAECLVELGDREHGTAILNSVEHARGDGRELPCLSAEEKWELLLHTARLTPIQLTGSGTEWLEIGDMQGAVDAAGSGGAPEGGAPPPGTPRMEGEHASPSPAPADVDEPPLRVRLQADLPGALERGEFELHYQPMVELTGGRVTALEALLRWRHPRHGLLLPGVFVPVAEQTGLIVPLGRWVLEQACSQVQDWRYRFATPEMLVSVNVSGVQLEHPEFVEMVRDALAVSQLPADRLMLEVTETVLVNLPRAVRLLELLREMGVRLAIDDFGCGFSSLVYLQRLPADFLKIDRTLTLGTE
ncbi:MAG TPA: EAL domain-containing protein, partial [Longimicrobiaceae bacterium]|nr:EAL domain-containing protein [Longimicrobiaceae bacterium]